MAGQNDKGGGSKKYGRNRKKYGHKAYKTKKNPKTKFSAKNVEGKQRMGSYLIPGRRGFDCGFGKDELTPGDINPYSHVALFQQRARKDPDTAKQVLQGLMPWARRGITHPRKKEIIRG